MEVRKIDVLKYTVMFLFVFTIGIYSVSATEYVNYYDINMTNQEYNNLLNLGFTEDEIYYMDLTTFEENKDIEATLVSSNTKYYKTVHPTYGTDYTVELTEEEYETESQISLLGEIETEYKTMVTTISQNGSKYRYKVSLLWKNMPSVRNYDIIAIGFNDEVYINSSVYFNYYHCDSSGTCYTASDYYDKKKLSTGGSAVYKLPSSSLSLSSVLYYDVSKDTTDTITSLYMCGDYSHATKSVSTSYLSDYSINTSGIALETHIYSKYDHIQCAPATWSGSW